MVLGYLRIDRHIRSVQFVWRDSEWIASFLWRNNFGSQIQGIPNTALALIGQVGGRRVISFATDAGTGGIDAEDALSRGDVGMGPLLGLRSLGDMRSPGCRNPRTTAGSGGITTGSTARVASGGGMAPVAILAFSRRRW